MPDNIKILAATPTDDTLAPPVATDLIGGAHYQRIKTGWGSDGIYNETTDADGFRFPVGGFQIGVVNEAAPISDIAPAGLNGRLQRIAQRLTSLIALLPTALGAGGGLKVDGSGTAIPISGSVGVLGTPPVTQWGAWTVQPGNTANTTRWKVDARERAITASGGTLQRPVNATPYSPNDALSTATAAASVAAQVFTVSDANDAPVAVERLRVQTNDTGLAAGVVLRAYLFAADPAANAGIVGGDNAPFSVKRGAFVGSLSGAFRAFADGGVAILVPDEGARIVTAPTSGAQTLYALFQVLGAFTPSGNSTALFPTLEGFQALA